MSFREFFSQQARNPSGWFGRLVMSRIFDKGNLELNLMMAQAMAVEPDHRILEIGCGTGLFLGQIAGSLEGGCIEGVEISETMAAMAGKKNKQALAQGRAKILFGDFHDLPLDEGAYDAVCSCNTVYFWPAPLLTLQRIHGLLKPGGRVVIAFEDKSLMENKPLSPEVFRLYSAADLADLIERAGFDRDTEVIDNGNPEAERCCVVARK